MTPTTWLVKYQENVSRQGSRTNSASSRNRELVIGRATTVRWNRLREMLEVRRSVVMVSVKLAAEHRSRPGRYLALRLGGNSRSKGNNRNRPGKTAYELGSPKVEGRSEVNWLLSAVPGFPDSLAVLL